MSRNVSAEQFTDSGWPSGTAARKARFVNTLLRFIAADCPREKFTKQLDGVLERKEKEIMTV